MKNKLLNKKIVIGESYSTPFVNKAGIYQDGTVPFARDKEGKLWAIAGHSHLGHISMFSGNDFTDLTEVYPIDLSFCVGHADYAFDKVRYPEGVKARGSIWPFGLYICPGTNRFFCFFHNETGWNGKGSAYDALGLCETPHYDSDFRHIGMMHSDDEGKTWVFDRWVLSAEEPCFTEQYKPDVGLAVGQTTGIIGLGAGDFTFYDDPNGEYVYIIYNIIRVDMNKSNWQACDSYIARSRKRNDGIFGDFVKYYDGSFCEAGNMGKETPIVENAWHARILYYPKLNSYIMASSPIHCDKPSSPFVANYLQLRTSNDLCHWSKPIDVMKDGKRFGSHYHGLLSYKGKESPQVVQEDEFTLLLGHNGTDVLGYDFKVMDK